MDLEQTPDEAAVKTVVESVATCIDRRDFQTLERLYADEVTRDYTSLSGGKPEVLSNTALLARWSGHLPGFDRTRHSLSNLAVQVAGDCAVADVDVVAGHWIGDMHWTVTGRHNYRLIRAGRDWRVAAQTFIFLGEEGSREAIARATAAAAANPDPYVVRKQARRVVLDFLTALEAKNGSGDTRGLPDRVVFYFAQDPSMVVVEYLGGVSLVPGGQVAEQTQVGIFQVQAGQIVLLRHYH